MRIDQLAGLAPGGADRSRGFGLIGAAGIELLADRGQRRIRQHEAAGLLERSISRRTAAASRLLASNSSRSKFEDIWMSIEGDAVACTSRTS